MSWRDPKFRYIRSDKQGEGYLARRFRQIKAEQQKNAQEAASKVKPIVRAKVSA